MGKMRLASCRPCLLSASGIAGEEGPDYLLSILQCHYSGSWTNPYNIRKGGKPLSMSLLQAMSRWEMDSTHEAISDYHWRRGRKIGSKCKNLIVWRNLCRRENKCYQASTDKSFLNFYVESVKYFRCLLYSLHCTNRRGLSPRLKSALKKSLPLYLPSNTSFEKSFGLKMFLL